MRKRAEQYQWNFSGKIQDIPRFDRLALAHSKGLYTPYSMNIQFSELFKEFGGACLEACETIQGSIVEYVGVGVF